MKEGADFKTLVGYRIHRANLLMDNDARAALGTHGLSPAKTIALMLIRDNPGCDQSALGGALSVNRSSAMKLVNILVERGMVERRTGRDARSNALHLTPLGQTEVTDMVAQVRKSDARMTGAMTDGEVEMLLSLLRKIGARS